MKEYLRLKKGKKDNQLFVWSKLMIFGAGIVISYASLFFVSSVTGLVFAYFGILFLSLILAMTIGHDAAHNAVTKNARHNHAIYWILFALNGINPGSWRLRHNHSHHHFPNVQGLDCDLIISSLIYLSAAQKKRSIHRFQHLYAPVLYLFFSLAWIFVIDVIQQRESMSKDISLGYGIKRWTKFLLVKIFYVSVFFILPAWLTEFSVLQVFLVWLSLQMILSLFLSFTFFMSHHVEEASYYNCTEQKVSSSWLQNQVCSTVDFHGQSEVANFFFGGFHAHVAHHLFPTVSHVHYPWITKIIREELRNTHIPYKSVNFFQGMVSHIKHLKQQGSITVQ